MFNAQLDLDNLILEDLEFETPCDGKRHTEGVKGHDPSQAATHFIKCPACGKTNLICGGRANYLRFSNGINCAPGCGIAKPGTDWDIGRIPGK